VAFLAVHAAAQGDERDLVALRLAECLYFLKQVRPAREALHPFLDKIAQAGRGAVFLRADRSRAEQRIGLPPRHPSRHREFPDQRWAEDALDDLATHYIMKSDDDKADEVFRELYEKFPTGRYAERAAWKLGWRAFRSEHFEDTVRVFDRASADFPRSDYRPAWLYCPGARTRRGTSAGLPTRDTTCRHHYLNSYYGRLALEQLHGVHRTAASSWTCRRHRILPGNEDIIRALLGVALLRPGHRRDPLRAKEWEIRRRSRPRSRGSTSGRQSRDGRAPVRALPGRHQHDEACVSPVHGAGGEGLPPELLR